MDDISCHFIDHGLYYSYNGDIRHCCIQERIDKQFDVSAFERSPQEFISTNTDLVAISEDISNGIKNIHCKRCWNDELVGIKSRRLNYSKNKISSAVDTKVIEYIDLRLGNKCNLKCKMCFPAWSNQIQQHFIAAKEHGIINDFNRHIDADTYSESEHYDYLKRVLGAILNTPTIKTIMLAGGEPFVMSEVEWFLNQLVDNKRTDISMNILTNVTVVTDRMVRLLGKFKSVVMQCSIDGVEEDIEYQRFPSKWSVIENNFIKLYQSGLKTTLVPCFSQLNTLSVLKFLTWTSSFEKTPVFFNEVSHPSFLNFQLIPIEYRQELIKELETFQLPKNVDKNYKVFFNKIKNNVRPITAVERKELKAATELWDFKSKIKYKEKYPWADFLLNHEQ